NVGQALLCRPPVSSLDQVPRDIDAQYVCAEFRRRQGRGSIAAAEIQHLESFRDSESLHERLAAFAHRIGDAREIAFFPKCSIRIHTNIHDVSLSLALHGRNTIWGAHAARVLAMAASPSRTF